MSLCSEAVDVEVAALAEELEDLAEAHPEISGTLRLAAGTLDAQKKEIANLKAKVSWVKSSLDEHLVKITAHLNHASGVAEENALSSLEHEVIKLLQGFILELADDSLPEDHEVDTEASGRGAYFDPAVRPPPPQDLQDPHRAAPMESSPGGRPAADDSSAQPSKRRRTSGGSKKRPASPRREGDEAPPAKKKGPSFQGEELKEQLRVIVRLRNNGKKGSTAEAERTYNGIPAGKKVGVRRLNMLAKGLENELFRVGGMETVKVVLEKFLSRTLVQLVSPDGTKDPAEEEVKDGIIGAAKGFFKNLLDSKGRRTDVDANAFWAAAVALLPADLLKDRKGRAATRLLDVNYRVLKKVRISAFEGSEILVPNMPLGDPILESRPRRGVRFVLAPLFHCEPGSALLSQSETPHASAPSPSANPLPRSE